MTSRTSALYASVTLSLVVGIAVCFLAAQRPAAREAGHGGGERQSLARADQPQAASAVPMAAAYADAARDCIELPTYPQFAAVGHVGTAQQAEIQLCQAYGGFGFFGPRPLCGVECGECYPGGQEPHWHDRQCLPFDMFGHGEYAGPARMPHVPQYRVRVDDILEFVYVLSRRGMDGQYKLEVGDRITVESITDEKLNRHHLESGETVSVGQGIIVQPDGNITLPLLGQVPAAGRTVAELTADLEERYKRFYRVPGITVTPLKVNTRLEDLRNAVDARFGQGGLARQNRVTPEGTIQLPIIGSVPAQGLTLDELEYEVNARYAAHIQGVEVTVVLADRAPRFVYVLGEVLIPGRYELTGPTTAMQAVALAGGWNNGGNLRQMVIFRRGEDWRLMATKLDLRGAMLGKRPCPADELWIRDSDIVLIPKSSLLLANDLIELVFTRGIYGVVPFQGISLNFAKLSTI